MSLKGALIAVLATLGTVVALPGLVLFLVVASAVPPPNLPTLLPTTANVGGPAAIPADAAQAYAAAAARVGALVPGCTVPASVLAGIGKVESNHTSPAIGPALDGSIPGTTIVHDTDGGALDGDPVWDHAVGPMQILPATWRRWAQDGDGDGRADPQDFADAALTAAVILCQPPADLSQPGPLDRALHAYNNSDAYVAEVESWAATDAVGAGAGASPSTTEVTQGAS